jgi:hypothetical protein
VCQQQNWVVFAFLVTALYFNPDTCLFMPFSECLLSLLCCARVVACWLVVVVLDFDCECTVPFSLTFTCQVNTAHIHQLCIATVTLVVRNLGISHVWIIPVWLPVIHNTTYPAHWLDHAVLKVLVVHVHRRHPVLVHTDDVEGHVARGSLGKVEGTTRLLEVD